MSVPEGPWVTLIPSVFVPKPVPVTVMRVPPELPVEGEMDTNVGTTDTEVKLE